MKKILILLTVMIGIISCESRSPNRISIECSDTIVLLKGETFEEMLYSNWKYIITKDTLGYLKFI